MPTGTEIEDPKPSTLRPAYPTIAGGATAPAGPAVTMAETLGHVPEKLDHDGSKCPTMGFGTVSDA